MKTTNFLSVAQFSERINRLYLIVQISGLAYYVKSLLGKDFLSLPRKLQSITTQLLVKRSDTKNFITNNPNSKHQTDNPRLQLFGDLELICITYKLMPTEGIPSYFVKTLNHSQKFARNRRKIRLLRTTFCRTMKS